MHYFFLVIMFLASQVFSEEVRHVYGIDNSIVGSLVFEDGILVNRTHYYYDEQGRRITLVMDDGSSEDLHDQTGVNECYIKNFKPHPLAKDDSHPLDIMESYMDLRTGKETILLHTMNFYNHSLSLMQTIVVDAQGNVMEIRFDENGRQASTLERPKEGGMVIMDYRYDDLGRIESISCQTDLGAHVILYTYDDQGKLIVVKEDGKSFNAPGKSQDWASFIQERYDYYQKSFAHTLSSLQWENLPHRQSLLKTIQTRFENFSEWLIGEHLFRISGYYSYPARKGVYGKGEASDKVRITFISGILNFPDCQMESLELFSKNHCDVNIHYLFRHCEGWAEAMRSCVYSKMGFISEQAKELAAMWRELIEEMGGVHSGGTIVHYAHSIGGTETDLAKTLMTPEELKMIRVFAIGTATIIPDKGFQKVVNYVSVRDGVPYVDFFNYVWSLAAPNSNVVYLGSFFEGYPIHDHLLTFPTYANLLEELGNDFIKEFCD